MPSKKPLPQRLFIKVDIKKSQTCIKKKKQKHNKKLANSYNSQGQGGEMHWLAHGRWDRAILRQWTVEELRSTVVGGLMCGWAKPVKKTISRFEKLDLKPNQLWGAKSSARQWRVDEGIAA
jgi:hypothetical protein